MQADTPIEKLESQRFMTGAYLHDDVKVYSALGEHRIATVVDRKTSEWLRQQTGGLRLHGEVASVPCLAVFSRAGDGDGRWLPRDSLCSTVAAACGLRARGSG